MVGNTIARIIFEANQQKHYVLFADCLFEYISSHPSLNSSEKLIWLNILRKSSFDSNLRCTLTHQQIALMVGLKPDTSYRYVRRLKDLGFLKSTVDKPYQLVTYSIDLPKEGIAAIQNAPNRKKAISDGSNNSIGDSNNPIKRHEGSENNPGGIGIKSGRVSENNPVGIGIKSGTPPDKNPILLINNNINNINNTHNNGKPAFEQSAVKNADALICDFECLHKKYAPLPPVKRMQKVLSHFSQDEMQLISSGIISRQRERESQEVLEKSPSCASRGGLSGGNILPLRVVPQNPSKLLDFKFENELFQVEEGVKDKILTAIPLLFEQNKIKGGAAEKPLHALLKEIFYYVTKSGSSELKKVTQLNRYYIAQKICLEGRWEKPKGMVNREILERERKWALSKRQENEAALAAMKAHGGCDAL